MSVDIGCMWSNNKVINPNAAAVEAFFAFAGLEPDLRENIYETPRQLHGTGRVGEHPLLIISAQPVPGPGVLGRGAQAQHRNGQLHY